MRKFRLNLRSVVKIGVACLVVCMMFFSCKDKEVLVTGVTLNKTELTLEQGKTESLIATVLPSDATNQAISWSSSNPAVASVLPSGLVTALSKGTATIQVSTQDGVKTASCVVTVLPPPHPAEPELVLVEGGTFMMGADDSDADAFPAERPAHQVTLSSFKISKYEVTQKQWVALMGTNPSGFKGENLPVENVSWDDVQEFIQRLNAATEKNYRLPTEAEWEYAARGGNKSKGYKYSGSNDVDAVVWYSGNSNGTTHAVGTKAPNELGIYDMTGNVDEWCQDWFDIDYYSYSPVNNPTGASTGTDRCCRGGGWCWTARQSRVTYRAMTRPNQGTNGEHYGFRLAIDK